MDITSYTIIFALLFIGFFDFYNLLKFKIKTSKKITKILINLIVSFFSISFLSVIISMPFEETEIKHETFIIITTIIVLIINFLRINDRKLNKGKLILNENGYFLKLIILIFASLGAALLLYIIYFYLRIGIEIFSEELTIKQLENYNGRIFIINLINNFLITIFGKFANEVAAISLIGIGSTIVLSFITVFFLFFEKKINTIRKKFFKKKI
jgi:hypothetical protein